MRARRESLLRLIAAVRALDRIPALLAERNENQARLNERARTRTAESIALSRARIAEIDAEIRSIRAAGHQALGYAEADLAIDAARDEAAR